MRGTVLVVDDEPPVRRLLTWAMEDLGCEVRAVRDAEAALAALEDGTPDLLLVDIRLPGMDGYALSQRMKTTLATSTFRWCS